MMNGVIESMGASSKVERSSFSSAMLHYVCAFIEGRGIVATSDREVRYGRARS
jgi:hypothetical protein